MRLTPSPWLFLRTVFGSLLAVFLVAYFWQGYGEGHWWSSGYMLSLAIPVVLFPAILWLAFVPSELVVSDEFLQIRYLLRDRHRIDWSDLKFWGNGGEATFLLQFVGRGTFQIALFAFPRNQRRAVVDFLQNRFPQRKARAWFGIWGIR